MNLPGFTAEASLYKTSERYQFAAEWTHNNNTKVITPQIPWEFLTFYCRWTTCLEPIPVPPFLRLVRCFRCG